MLSTIFTCVIFISRIHPPELQPVLSASLNSLSPSPASDFLTHHSHPSTHLQPSAAPSQGWCPPPLPAVTHCPSLDEQPDKDSPLFRDHLAGTLTPSLPIPTPGLPWGDPLPTTLSPSLASRTRWVLHVAGTQCGTTNQEEKEKVSGANRKVWEKMEGWLTRVRCRISERVTGKSWRPHTGPVGEAHAESSPQPQRSIPSTWPRYTPDIHLPPKGQRERSRERERLRCEGKAQDKGGEGRGVYGGSPPTKGRSGPVVSAPPSAGSSGYRPAHVPMCIPRRATHVLLII